jgi:small subunit ribosomal protein S13
LKEAGVDFNTRVKDLTEEELNKIRAVVDKVKVEGDLRKDVRLSVKRLMDIRCYRGLRHKMNLPVRGQKSKTNARTVKGPKKPIKR